MTLFLGVDGGQSGTTAVIGDEYGCILGRGEGGPCNHAGIGEGRAKLERAVNESLAAACMQAGLDFDTVHFRVACFGMSGGPDDKQAILGELLRVERLIVTTDAMTALAGATRGGAGVVVIAGTGSIAFGRNAEGRSARAGGWGYIFGDEGGAFDIVRQALRAALRMEEGWGEATALRKALLNHAGPGVSTPRNANELLHRFYTAEWPRPRVAKLAQLVDAVAGGGDRVAVEILNQAATRLAMLATSVRSQLWNPGAPVEVAYIGGVFESGMVLERFRTLVELEEGNRCIAPKHGPAEGALLEAYRLEGLKVIRIMT
jgi:N-acetylglucosamine kinase-like BadF-type ATPase